MNKILTALKNTENELSNQLAESLVANSVLISTQVELPRDRVIYLLKRRGKGKYRIDNFYWEGYEQTLEVLQNIQDETVTSINIYLSNDLYTVYFDLNFKVIGIIKLENNGIEHLINIKLDFGASSLKFYHQGELKNLEELFNK